MSTLITLQTREKERFREE